MELAFSAVKCVNSAIQHNAKSALWGAFLHHQLVLFAYHFVLSVRVQMIANNASQTTTSAILHACLALLIA